MTRRHNVPFESFYRDGLVEVSAPAEDRHGHRAIAGDDHVFPMTIFDQPETDEADNPEITHTAEELAAAVEKACRDTASEVEHRTRETLAAEIEAKQAQALGGIREQLSQYDMIVMQWMSDMRATIQFLAKTMGQAVVPRALERQPLADIDDMLRQTLSRLADQPAIEVRMASDLVERSEALLNGVAEETGFRGKLVVVADPTLRAGDARLVWKNGNANRCLQQIQEEAEAIVDVWLTSLPSDPIAGSNPGDQKAGSDTADAFSTKISAEQHALEEEATS